MSASISRRAALGGLGADIDVESKIFKMS